MINFILKYRLDVSCLMFCICFLSFAQKNMEAFLISLSFSSLFSFIYILNKVADAKEDAVNVRARPMDRKWGKYAMSAAIFLAIAPMPYLFFVNLKILIFYILVPGLFGVLYSYPLRIFGFSRRLKDVPFAKNIISALVWASVPFALGLIYYKVSPSFASFEIFVTVVMVVFIIELLFDIRDIDGDLAAGIKTFPNQMGIAFSKAICLVMLVSLCIFKYVNLHLNGVYLISYISTFFIILMIKKDSNVHFFQAISFVWCVVSIVNVLKAII